MKINLWGSVHGGVLHGDAIHHVGAIVVLELSSGDRGLLSEDNGEKHDESAEDGGHTQDTDNCNEAPVVFGH